MELLGGVVQAEARSSFLETVLISAKDTCTACAVCITGMESFLATHDETPR
jgi:hypothetical protein